MSLNCTFKQVKMANVTYFSAINKILREEWVVSGNPEQAQQGGPFTWGMLEGPSRRRREASGNAPGWSPPAHSCRCRHHHPQELLLLLWKRLMAFGSPLWLSVLAGTASRSRREAGFFLPPAFHSPATPPRILLEWGRAQSFRASALGGGRRGTD